MPAKWKETDLPAREIADALVRSSVLNSVTVVTAPPGAGKSTLLPLAVLESLPADGGKILMLEPRRIAARQIAARMASLLEEEVGETVGYRIRFEKKVSRRTRIEVLTEGVLTRMLVEDPELRGVAVLIFDEFHERSLQTDLALALSRESQAVLRPGLKLVLMSATLDEQVLCQALGARLLSCSGKLFPVSVFHVGDVSPETLVEATVRTVRTALREQTGDILAFLPGEGEIRRCAELLAGLPTTVRIAPLYGMLSLEEQRRAIAPSPSGQRKIVLATPIAETSLTIEGVRTVVDAGYCRRPVCDPRTGMEHLATVRISLDMAMQRTGRAGRLAPGVCYRLWSKAAESRMAAQRQPEILDADFSPLLLQVAAWGESHPENLPWHTPPSAPALHAARKLLFSLHAIDEAGRITARGRKLASLPCHPRIAQMLLTAADDAQRALAADVAALLEEKDPLSAGDDPDISLRIEALRRARESGRPGVWGRIARIATQYREMIHVAEDNGRPDAYAVGMLLASAYPERVARPWKEGRNRFCLASGDLAVLPEGGMLDGAEWLAVASAFVQSGTLGRIFLAAPLSPDDLKPMSREREIMDWDSKAGCVAARREWRIGVHLLASRTLSTLDRDAVVAVIVRAARKEGRTMFDFSADVENLQRRIASVAAWHPEQELPDLSTDSVLERAGEWLPLYIGQATSAAQLRKIDLCSVLWGMLDCEQQHTVEQLAPSHITVPTGSRIRLEYRQGTEVPVLRVRLQECFGLLDTPRVDDGRRPVLMELLSPGYKPVQLTSDLRSFWTGTYFEVRKELRRRYPKHAWPDDPLDALPTRRPRGPYTS
ncbi:MAG: ATP-dependent helicase HrpB [Bacteroidales bacterium]|nr:ATP-dependent helicase HrpB [Bacteroidales bacterium]